MTLTVKVTRNDNNSLHLLRIEVTEESIQNFIQLVDRALNCWDSAPVELKELGDMLTHGYVTQDHTIQQINSKHNTEYYNPEEYALIEEYIREHGFAAWKERIAEGTSHQIAAGKSVEKKAE